MEVRTIQNNHNISFGLRVKKDCNPNKAADYIEKSDNCINRMTNGDAFLQNRLGYEILYRQGSTKDKSKKILSRYTSTAVQSQLKYVQANFSENDLLSNISHIRECCNLNKTRAVSLPKLKEVGVNLTLDTSSNLENLRGLKHIGGVLNVVANSMEEMNKFLKKIGIISSDGAVIPKIKKGIKLIRK